MAATSLPYPDGRPGFARVLPLGHGDLAPGATSAVFLTRSGEPQRPPA